VARNDALSERDKRRLAIANREIRTIERMLSLFSEYGREAPLAKEAVDPKAIVEGSAALLEPELSERDIRVEIDAGGALRKVPADLLRLRPVLSQLFLTIASSLDDGGVLRIGIESGKHGSTITVHDATAHIPADARESLFEPFGTFPERGPGLSLAVLKRLMTLHGGSLEVEEHEGQGVTFELAFPS
jgi:two-component system sensor histidine kinase HydH